MFRAIRKLCKQSICLASNSPSISVKYDALSHDKFVKDHQVMRVFLRSGTSTDDAICQQYEPTFDVFISSDCEVKFIAKN